MYQSYLALLARLQIEQKLQGKVDPSDLVQETFLQAQRKFAQFRGTTEGQIVAWLREILASRIAMLVRHYHTQKGDVRLERQLGEELDRSSEVLGHALVATGSSPSQHAVRREQAVLLADALAKLTGEYREVIIRRHLQGKSFPQVAREMGRSVDSVKNMWARAIARLRRLIGES